MQSSWEKINRKYQSQRTSAYKLTASAHYHFFMIFALLFTPSLLYNKQGTVSTNKQHSSPKSYFKQDIKKSVTELKQKAFALLLLANEQKMSGF